MSQRNGNNSTQGEKAIIALSRGHKSARVQESDLATGRRMQPEWLSLRGLGEYAQVSERTLRAWIHSSVDPLPAVRIGGKILVRRQDFDSWLGRHRIIPAESIDVSAIVKEIVVGATSER